MFSYTVFFGLLAVAAAQCGCGYNSGIVGDAALLNQGLVSNVASVGCAAPANQVVSNNCRCVKTVLRPKLNTYVEVQPTERREVQTFTRPVVQTYSYNINAPINAGPVVSDAPIINNLGLGYGQGIVGSSYLNAALGQGIVGSSLLNGAYASPILSGSIVGSGLGCNGLVGGVNTIVGAGSLGLNNLVGAGSLGLNTIVGGCNSNLVPLNNIAGACY